MEILGVPIYNDYFVLLLVRFGINLFFCTLIIKAIYSRYVRQNNYVFAFFMVSTTVFFLCFTLSRFSLDLGMALGLFAIFGIIRYRTTTIGIKEMTYLFVVICISVINALVSKEISYLEILTVNSTVVMFIFGIEHFLLQSTGLEKQSIVYDDLENIKPEHRDRLLKDLSDRTGFSIEKVRIDKIDLQKEAATLTLYYHPHPVETT